MNRFDPAPLLGDLTVTLDIDVLIGRYPGADSPDGDPAKVGDLLRQRGIGKGAIASLKAALFDVSSGNDDTLSLVDAVPVGVVDLRDPIGARTELDRLAAAGVHAVRLFPDEQAIEPDFPSVRHIARAAATAGMTLLTGGDIRRFWRPFSGIEADVVFLDTHFYHLGDFLLIAADEPGFHTSTRLLTSPDALELVAERLDARRLVYGSRAPIYEPLVPMLRLATSGLTDQDKALVAGGNAHRLLELA